VAPVRSGRTPGRWVIVYLLVAGCARPVLADSPVRYQLGDPIFQVVAGARAIPQNIVSCLAQDRAGFLWIGTPDGVVRYDGYSFRAFRHDPKDPRSLIENHVRVIHGASDGRVWIGTSGGIAIFEPSTETFSRIGVTKPEKPGLASPQIRDLAEAGGGRVWVATPKGLDLVDAKTLRVSAVDPKPKEASSADRAALGALLVDRRGDLWIGSADGLAVRRANGVIEAVAVAPAEGDSLAGKSVGHLFEAGDGAIWIGISGGGLARLDAKTGVVRLLDRDDVVRPSAFAQPGPETVWVGSLNEGGIEVRDAATGSVLHRFRHDVSVPESLASNRIDSLLTDRSGVVWIGTGGSGLARYNPADSGFSLFRATPARPEGLTDGIVRRLFESSDGLLWVASRGDGVLVFDATRRVASYQVESDPGGPSEEPSVSAITESADGAIWMGTSGALHRLDRKAGRIERFSAQPFGKQTGRIGRLLPARDETGLWVATRSGLAFFDTGTHTSSVAELDDGRKLTGNVTDVAYAQDGVLWVTTLTGVAALPKGATRFRRFASSESAEGALPSESTLSILPDSKGRLWIGTSNGLLRLAAFDGKTARFESIAARLGMENSRCDNLLEDDSGRIWIEDDAVFDPTTFETRTFGPDEGAGRSIWRGAAIKTRSGQIVLGGPDGLFFIDPSRVQPWRYSPSVVLTALRIDGKPLPAAGPSELVVRPGTKTVELEFAALDFSAPGRNRYAYRLRGVYGDFTEVDAEHRRATYTSLPPGKYIFEVRGSNREGAWSRSSLSLPIHAEPAFYQTALFRIAVGLFLVGLTWPVYRIRLRLLEARQRELEGLVTRRTVEARDSEQRALEASQAKSVFLANMSHELRTPLNAVLGFAQLMRRSRSLEADDRENLSIIQRSGEHLLSLINQVLSISKIEAGKMTLDARPFDLRDMLLTLERMFRARTEEARLSLQVEIDEGLPDAVRGDEGKLRQALINLLGNAVKFTSAGTVSLRARWQAGRAVFEVSDTGAGIAEDELPALFQPFAQTESGRDAKEGTGLGLAITRRIVELMGGTISVQSRRGEGTTFRFDVALEPCEPVPLEQGPRRVVRIAQGQRPPRIAVVDDTPESRSLLRKLLEAVGFDVREAGNGAAALALCREWRPELVFMDVRMPVMDGREATRRIRQEERDEPARGGPGTVIVGLTASVFEQEAETLRAGGADEVLFKPFREEALFDVLAARLGVRFEYAEATGTLRSERPRLSALSGPAATALRAGGQRVLVADDDTINRAIAAELLASAGYEVVEGKDGEDALALLESAGPFDAVLLDVEMPRLGGIETVRRIRLDSRFRGLPVVAMTAHGDPGDAARLMALGMDDHIAKPFEPEELLRKIGASVERRPQTKAAGISAGP